METPDSSPSHDTAFSLAELAPLVEAQRAQMLLAGPTGAPIPAPLLDQLRRNANAVGELEGEARRLRTHSDGLLNGFKMAVGLHERDVDFDLAAGTYAVPAPPAETSGDAAAQEPPGEGEG